MDDWLDKMKEKDDYEKRMRAEHRCIVCGTKLIPSIWGGKEHYRYDTCKECNNRSKPKKEIDLHLSKIIGSGNISLHHEGLRRMGYSTYNRGGPDMRKVEERDKE